MVKRGSRSTANSDREGWGDVYDGDHDRGGHRAALAGIRNPRAFAPWVLFAFLGQHSTLLVGALVAFAAAVVIALPSTRAGRPKALEIGAVVTFAGFSVVAIVADHATTVFMARYARAIAAGLLALIAFTSLLFTLFTEQYARESVPREYWSSPRFKQINRGLTPDVGLRVFADDPLPHSRRRDRHPPRQPHLQLVSSC